MKADKRDVANIVILLLLVAGVVWLSLRVVWLGDDLDYMFRMNGAIWESWGWIRSPHVFFQSQWTHYLHVNGRFVAHSLVQLFNSILGRTAFSIANGIVWGVTAIVLTRLGGTRRLSPESLLSSVILLGIGFLTKMMPTCQIGYVWGLGVNLLWVGLFLSGRERGKLSVSGLCILGLVAGNWNEAYSIGIGGSLGVILLSQWLRHPIKRLTSSQQSAAIFYILGTASVCLAPSTLSRAVSVSGPASAIVMVSPPGWLYALLSFRILYIFIAVLIYSKITGRLRFRSFIYSEMIWVSSMILLLIFNLVLGVFGNRQLFGVEMCAAVLTLRLLPNHRFDRFWIVSGLVAVIGLYGYQYFLSREVCKQYDEIEALYIASDKGRVYYDRHRVSNNGWIREARIYEDIVGLYDNDPHHSLMKYWRHTYPKQRPLQIIPTGLIFKDTVMNYAPGHYIVIGKSNDTVTFRARGLFRDIERKYDFHKSLKGPGEWRVIVITPTDPWLTPEL